MSQLEIKTLIAKYHKDIHMYRGKLCSEPHYVEVLMASCVSCNFHEVKIEILAVTGKTVGLPCVQQSNQ